MAGRWACCWVRSPTLYAAYEAGQASALAPLPLQYADYTQWQRQWLQGELLERQIRYWRERLAGAAPQLELPTDHARPALQSYRGEKVAIELGAALTEKIKAFAHRQDITPFMVLYLAWAVLLFRLSGQEDIVVGTPVANRRRPELDGLIGFFVNTLALRLNMRGEMSVKELVEQVREVTLRCLRSSGRTVRASGRSAPAPAYLEPQSHLPGHDGLAEHSPRRA